MPFRGDIYLGAQGGTLALSMFLLPVWTSWCRGCDDASCQQLWRLHSLSVAVFSREGNRMEMLLPYHLQHPVEG